MRNKLRSVEMSALCLILAIVFPAWGWDNLDVGCPYSIGLQIVDREGYALGFYRDWHNAVWVQYRLTATEVGTVICGRSDDFREDSEVIGCATLLDYARSGYDRGHLAPSADMRWDRRVQSESFFMSNMTPQHPNLNRGVWADLEREVRRYALREGTVVIATGPVFFGKEAKYIGNRVLVPDACYKVIYDETEPRKMIGFIIPNRKCPRDFYLYAVTVDEVERITGLDFFCAVEGADMLEASLDVEAWRK